MIISEGYRQVHHYFSHYLLWIYVWIKQFILVLQRNGENKRGNRWTYASRKFTCGEIFRHVSLHYHSSKKEISFVVPRRMLSTFQTVFWSLFGLAEKDGVRLEDYNKRFTETIGYLIYGAFNIASVIVLLNMLIAMMSKSYETIEEHADVEWKFARSKLYMEYVKEGKSIINPLPSDLSTHLGGTLPVPFNIIPTPKDIHYFVRRIFTCFKRIKNPHEGNAHAGELNDTFPLTIRMNNNPNPTSVSPRRHANIPTISNGRMVVSNEPHPRSRQGSFEITQQLTYRKVIHRMIKRFLLHKQREEQGEIHEGDFEELKQDIQMLRFEMLNRLEETRDDLMKSNHLLNEGVMIVGDLLSSCFQPTNSFVQENFQFFKKSFSTRTTDSGLLSNTSIASSTTQLEPMTGNYLLQLAVTHIGLQQIIEDEETQENQLPFIDDEEEDIPAQHMATQTSFGDFTKF